MKFRCVLFKAPQTCNAERSHRGPARVITSCAAKDPFGSIPAWRSDFPHTVTTCLGIGSVMKSLGTTICSNESISVCAVCIIRTAFDRFLHGNPGMRTREFNSGKNGKNINSGYGMKLKSN